MRIQRFNPADSGAVRAICETREAVRLADEPYAAPFAPQMLCNWLTEGWTADPVTAWYVPGSQPGTVDGFCRLELPDLENQDRAGLTLMVHPSRRRAGLGTELLRHAVREAAGAGRTTLSGTVLRGSDGEAFAQRAGATFGIEDIRRQHDVRAIPAGLLASLRETAEKAAVGYSLVSWTGPVPEDRLGQVAAVVNALNDAPHDAGVEPDIWDAGRVRDRWNGPAPRFGFREHAVAAVLDATGEMAGIAQIMVHPDTPEWGIVAFTAVRREHRGHKLGLLVKAAITEQLLFAEPELRRIMTVNAASNRYMIAVNELLGYEVAGPPCVSVELPVAALPNQS
jgi:GNAT superfamily N-acetyltransferase